MNLRRKQYCPIHRSVFCCVVQSEIEGGVFLGGLPPDTVLQIRTLHHFHTATLLGDGSILISGHPQYCPQPVQVTIAGSTWGGSMLKMRFIGRSVPLEVSSACIQHADYHISHSGNPRAN